MEDILYKLVSLHYKRSKFELTRGTFRVRGDHLEVLAAYTDEIVKITINHGLIGKIEVRPLFGGGSSEIDRFILYPAKHYLTNPETMGEAFKMIREDLKIRLEELNKKKKYLEAHRLEQRVKYDLEMIAQTMGFQVFLFFI